MEKCHNFPMHNLHNRESKFVDKILHRFVQNMKKLKKTGLKNSKMSQSS